MTHTSYFSPFLSYSHTRSKSLDLFHFYFPSLCLCLCSCLSGSNSPSQFCSFCFSIPISLSASPESGFLSVSPYLSGSCSFLHTGLRHACLIAVQGPGHQVFHCPPNSPCPGVSKGLDIATKQSLCPLPTVQAILSSLSSKSKPFFSQLHILKIGN